MVTSFSLIFSPSSDHTMFRIKEKPYNCPNVKNVKRKRRSDVFPFLHKDVCIGFL
jgi:hypothetical protein